VLFRTHESSYRYEVTKTSQNPTANSQNYHSLVRTAFVP
jgi:hypothetical protein